MLKTESISRKIISLKALPRVYAKKIFLFFIFSLKKLDNTLETKMRPRKNTIQ
jgi:hypothetical protein